MNNLSLEKLTNKQLIETLLKQIEENTGFHISSKEYMNSYFMYSDKEFDTICHFRIKEIPGFLFALWNTSRVTMPYENLSPLSELIFFTQYERDLDKFKPSRSGFVVGLYRNRYIDNTLTKLDEDREIWNTYELEDILQYMHKHPVKSYVYVQMQMQNVWEEVSGFTALQMFLKDWLDDKKFKLANHLKLKQQISAVQDLAKHLKCTSVFAFNRNEHLYPSISVNVRRKDNVLLKDYEHDTDLLAEFEDNWCAQLDIQYWELDAKTITNCDTAKEDFELGVRYELFKHNIIQDEDYDVFINI